MTEIRERLPTRMRTYVVPALLSLGALAATTVLESFHPEYFIPLFGSANPFLVTATIAALGVASLGLLQSRLGFKICAGRCTFKNASIVVVLATLFAVPTIFVDFTFGIPLALNVPPPWSLVFYPALGYVAEISFHAIPMAVLVALLWRVTKTSAAHYAIYFSIFIAATVEPLFQLGIAPAGSSFSWVRFYIGSHLFIFGLAQLYIYRRFDFVSMFSFRLVYYFWWHIVWGPIHPL